MEKVGSNFIIGRSFDRETIQKEERRSLNNYLTSDEPFLSDSSAYYALLFEQVKRL